MPVTIRKPQNPISEWADPKNDSVLDGVIERATKRIVNSVGPFIGLGDTGLEPENIAAQMAGPMGPVAAPMITIFKNKMARKKSTQAFLKKAKEELTANSYRAAQNFAREYPRVAAHIDPYFDLGDYAFNPRYATAFVPQVGPVSARVPVGITRAGEDLARGSADEATKTMYEEGTHVAQSLGNSQMARLYKAATRIAGHDKNPFEVNAKRASETAIYNLPQPKYVPAIKQLEEMANKHLMPPTNARLARALEGSRDPKDLAALDSMPTSLLESIEKALTIKRIIESRRKGTK